MCAATSAACAFATRFPGSVPALDRNSTRSRSSLRRTSRTPSTSVSLRPEVHRKRTLSEVVMSGLGRRAFVEALVVSPFGSVALTAQTPTTSAVKVAAGSGRAGDIIKLPGGDLIHIKVSAQDSG